MSSEFWLEIFQWNTVNSFCQKILCCSWCFQQEIKDDESNQHIDFASGNVHLITTKESWDEKLSQAIKDGKIVIANFSATWCGPCRVIAPFYSELSEKHPSLMFLLVDVDELTEFSTSWDIKATPTFFFLKDGNQVDKLVGANKPELQKKITAILDSIDQSQKWRRVARGGENKAKPFWNFVEPRTCRSPCCKMLATALVLECK